MIKRTNSIEQYFEKIPLKNRAIKYTNSNKTVILEIENKGFFKKLTQVFFKKPKTSYIHLDEIGSFIWLLINGKRNVYSIGKLLKEHFNDDAEPLFERLTQYFYILEQNNLIEWKKD